MRLEKYQNAILRIEEENKALSDYIIDKYVDELKVDNVSNKEMILKKLDFIYNDLKSKVKKEKLQTIVFSFTQSDRVKIESCVERAESTDNHESLKQIFREMVVEYFQINKDMNILYYRLLFGESYNDNGLEKLMKAHNLTEDDVYGIIAISQKCNINIYDAKSYDELEAIYNSIE